jgi:murein DD-endopeptidase MepM/ murein hydrolase activator NlpD
MPTQRAMQVIPPNPPLVKGGMGNFQSKHSTVIVFVMSVFLIFLIRTPANAFHAEVLPYEISPGDAFILKLTDAKTSQHPAAYLKEKQFYFSSCGKACFIAIGAVEIQTKPGVYTIKLKVGKKKKNLKLFVKHTRFPTLSLTLPEDKVFLSPEDLSRAKRESEKLQSMCQIVSDRLWEGNFILPLENHISTLFGTKRILNKTIISIHKGLDIKGKEGEEVKASNNGRVVLAQELFFGGNTIILDHGQGIYTIYMHLSGFNVKLDDIISKGDIVGFVGSSGRSTGSHLHFGVKVLNINTNPVSFVELDL